MATIAEPLPMPRSEPAAAVTGELTVRRLVIAHVWVAIAAFAVACLLGVWQMWARSPLEAPAHTAANYFRSVTLHGVSMAFVLTTFFIMGFGYFVAETALKRPLPGLRLAWGAFWLGLVGVLMAALSVISGNASVLYTFYPPLTATAWFYIGLVLVVVASWIWCLLMIVAMRQWRTANPGQPVPLAMFGTVANAVMWLWTTVGVAAELLFQVIPGRARPQRNGRRRAVAHPVFLDAPRDRLFLAIPELHRLLHDGAARRRRAALFGHDGPDRLRPVPALLAARRAASSVHGSGAFERVQILPDVPDRPGFGPDLPHRLHHHRLDGSGRTDARRQRDCSAGSARCPGTGRWCWRPALPSSCCSGAAAAG